jgi:hypothetical protein
MICVQRRPNTYIRPIKSLEELLQALRQLKLAAPRSVERGRQAAASALALLDTLPCSDELVPSNQQLGIIENVHQDAGLLPPPKLPAMSSKDVKAFLRLLCSQLLVVSQVDSVTDLQGILSLTAHVSQSCSVPLARGMLFLLLSPVGVRDEDELPPWAPCPRLYMCSLTLPYSRLSTVCPSPLPHAIIRSLG